MKIDRIKGRENRNNITIDKSLTYYRRDQFFNTAKHPQHNNTVTQGVFLISEFTYLGNMGSYLAYDAGGLMEYNGKFWFGLIRAQTNHDYLMYNGYQLGQGNFDGCYVEFYSTTTKNVVNRVNTSGSIFVENDNWLHVGEIIKNKRIPTKILNELYLKKQEKKKLESN